MLDADRHGDDADKLDDPDNPDDNIVNHKVDNDVDDNVDHDAVVLEIDGCLDLHHFAPREVKELVPDYLAECLARGILDLRIVHGKGSGTLRTIVHAILERHPAVVWFGHRPEAGSWGATVVKLQCPSEEKES